MKFKFSISEKNENKNQHYRLTLVFGFNVCENNDTVVNKIQSFIYMFDLPESVHFIPTTHSLIGMLNSSRI